MNLWITKIKVRTMREFGGLSGVKAHVRKTGKMVALCLADGRLRGFWLEGGRIHQKTWPKWGLLADD
jgi:hypothetical protein